MEQTTEAIASDETLEAGLTRVWDALEAGSRKRKHEFHDFTLATLTPDGLPSARTIILREFDREERTLRFNVDIRSPKAAELQDGAPVCCVFYGREEKLQVRLWGRTILHHQDDLCRQVWETMHPLCYVTYGAPLAPGTVRETLDLLEPLPLDRAFKNLALCYIRITELDWLSLHVTGHLRAHYRWADDGSLTAKWLAP